MRHNELKKVYQKAAQPVENINLITDVQDSQATRFLSPLIAFDAFRDYMANRETGKQNRPQAAADFKLLPFFLQERIQLRALKFLPVVVRYEKVAIQGRENNKYNIIKKNDMLLCT